MNNKMFIEDLPKRGKTIDWKKSKGMKVHFIHNNLEGDLIIKDVFPSKHTKILIEFEGKEAIINTSHFKKCNIEKLLNDRKLADFKYNINYVTTNCLTILDRYYKKDTRNYNEKKYKLKCNICENITVLRESQINITGCPVCKGRKVKKGINDIATIRPDLLKYFVNIEDSYSYTKCSEHKVTVKCPECGEYKIIPVKDLVRNGIGCLCDKGFSYAERFMYYLLKINKIKFIYQYSKKNAKWCKNYRYDFYLIDYNTIIETNGEQHYTHSFIGCGGEDLESIKYNDIQKKKLALSNGIKEYIELDCSKSNYNFIVSEIRKSKLNNIINTKESIITECSIKANGNILKKVCNVWNKYKNVTEVLKHIEIINSRTTIIKYLKEGTKLGLCEYDPKHELQKSMKLNSYSINKNKYKLS